MCIISPGGYHVHSTYVYVWRRVWRYRRGNQNAYIEEEQTTQWPREKVQEDKQQSIKHTHKTKDWVTRTTLKPGMNSLTFIKAKVNLHSVLWFTCSQTKLKLFCFPILFFFFYFKHILLFNKKQSYEYEITWKRVIPATRRAFCIKYRRFYFSYTHEDNKFTSLLYYHYLSKF